jgi:hypothetical protein
MSASKEVRIGKMPGKLHSYVVAIGTSIADVIKMANLDTSGHSIEVDGTIIADTTVAKVTEDTSLILLVKLVKGNK